MFSISKTHCYPLNIFIYLLYFYLFITKLEFGFAKKNWHSNYDGKLFFIDVEFLIANI